MKTHRPFRLPLVPIALLAATTAAFAQSVRPEPPDGALLKEAPDGTKWVVTFSYPQDRTKPPPGFVETRTRTLTSIKAGNIIEVEAVDARGGKREDWRVGRDLYSKWTGATEWMQVPAKDVGPVVDFRGLDWLSKDDYVGSLQLAGHNCLVFVANAPKDFNLAVAGGTAEALDRFQQVAFIDAETRLPVEVRNYGDYQDYRFSDAPSARLKLPLDLVEQLKRDQAILSRLGGQPPAQDP